MTRCRREPEAHAGCAGGRQVYAVQRVHREPGISPSCEPALQDREMAEALSSQSMCHPGTGCLSGSRTVQDDLRVWRQVAGALWSLLKGHPNRHWNVP